MVNPDKGARGKLRLLRIGEETGFVLTPSGRIEAVNDPGRSHGPRLNLSGCSEGNRLRIHRDVPNHVAEEIAAVAGSELPWSNADSDPKCLSQLVALLASHRPVERIEREVDHILPNGLRYEHSAGIVRSDSVEGGDLVARFEAMGMPQSMIEAGFKCLDDLWPPWCIALAGEEVAAIAFAARLSARGAAIGVYTFEGFRGRGIAAAVTAAWSSLPVLADRLLFYSARRDNHSSRRVIERLGLPLIGASLRIH